MRHESNYEVSIAVWASYSGEKDLDDIDLGSMEYVDDHESDDGDYYIFNLRYFADVSAENVKEAAEKAECYFEAADMGDVEYLDSELDHVTDLETGKIY